MGDNDKASLRANVIERKRLEQLVSIYENSKRNLISDMRKSQASYRRKLKAYRERKREITMSKAKNSDSAIEELLFEQLRSRHPVVTRSGLRSSINGQETINTLSRHTTVISEMTEPISEDSRVFKSRLASYDVPLSANKLPANLDSGIKGQTQNTDLLLAVPDSSETSDSARHHTMTMKTISDRKSKPMYPPESRSSASIQTLISTMKSDVKHGGIPSTKGKHGPQTMASSLPSIQKSDNREGNVCPVEPGFEMPRSSSRQRSRLDLRPRTAWDLQNSDQPVSSNTKSDVVNWERLRENISGSYSQVVYLDKDELEERGTFYNYLLRGRLEREQTRFANICNRVQDFCRSPGLYFVLADGAEITNESFNGSRRPSRRAIATPSQGTNDIQKIPTLKQYY
ncbi:hypothetical protein Btru_013495 [Bulinus truncatus]|nr:hypothetical protein Btru_013495 [Bulinus truncatus]